MTIVGTIVIPETTSGDGGGTDAVYWDDPSGSLRIPPVLAEHYY